MSVRDRGIKPNTVLCCERTRSVIIAAIERLLGAILANAIVVLYGTKQH
jgi:hypothetical protein